MEIRRHCLRVFAALCACLFGRAVALGQPPAAAPAPAAAARVLLDAAPAGEPLDLSRYGLGQGGLSPEPMFAEQAPAVRALRVNLVRLFVQEYFHVYPRRGEYRWEALDRSVENILRAGAKPLMCLCLKPKALYPEIDQDRVHPTSYEEWEELIDRLVKHYNVDKKCGIAYWEVFNEPDIGERGGCPGRFTPADYVTYYERTARAILRADPSARVGGPALAHVRSPILTTLIEACAQKNIPLHFVSWHAYTNDPAEVRRGVEWVHERLRRFPTLRCETILDEWNMSLFEPRTEPAFQPCFIVETIAQMREAGLDAACYYHIRDAHVAEEEFAPFMSARGTREMAAWWNRTPQYCALFDFQGVVRPSYFAFAMLSRVRGERLEARREGADVRVLAACDRDAGMVHALVWNFALAPPPAVRVTLAIRNLPEGKWRYRRFVLDAATPSSQENDRMRVVGAGVVEKSADPLEEFELPPYGVTLVALQRK